MEKIQVLWIDQAIKDDLLEIRRNLYCGYYPNTRIRIVNSPRGLQRLADNSGVKLYHSTSVKPRVWNHIFYIKWP